MVGASDGEVLGLPVGDCVTGDKVVGASDGEALGLPVGD